MAKHEATTYTCDFCNKQCDPVRELSYVHSRSDPFSHSFNRISFRVSGSIPYGGPITGNDVCRDCVREALKSIVENLGGDGKEAAR